MAAVAVVALTTPDRSLLTTSVEHALYGVLAFTVGLGHLFYHAAGR
ncbi:hypothetical protein KIF24_31750 [Micromonospora sp. Llam7]|nr:hypothetical protein [Micromonospora tarapacensis]MBX7270148.1 hypothetical protein [Micromonospora tarapacensis]